MRRKNCPGLFTLGWYGLAELSVGIISFDGVETLGPGVGAGAVTVVITDGSADEFRSTFGATATDASFIRDFSVGPATRKRMDHWVIGSRAAEFGVVAEVTAGISAAGSFIRGEFR